MPISQNLFKTAFFKFTHKDLATVTGSADRTSPLLQDGAVTLNVLVRNVAVYCVESWTDSVTLAVGTAADPDRHVVAVTSTGGDLGLCTGAAFISPDVTVTTVGSNTGTAAAGLSLIGDTSSVDQSAALMNDLVAIQEDLVALEEAVDGSSLAPGGVIEAFSAGAGMIATLTTGGTDWNDNTAGEFVVVVEYLDFCDVTSTVFS